MKSSVLFLTHYNHLINVIIINRIGTWIVTEAKRGRLPQERKQSGRGGWSSKRYQKDEAGRGGAGKCGCVIRNMGGKPGACGYQEIEEAEWISKGSSGQPYQMLL